MSGIRRTPSSGTIADGGKFTSRASMAFAEPQPALSKRPSTGRDALDALPPSSRGRTAAAQSPRPLSPLRHLNLPAAADFALAPGTVGELNQFRTEFEGMQERVVAALADASPQLIESLPDAHRQAVGAAKTLMGMQPPSRVGTPPLSLATYGGIQKAMNQSIDDARALQKKLGRAPTEAELRSGDALAQFAQMASDVGQWTRKTDQIVASLNLLKSDDSKLLENRPQLKEDLGKWTKAAWDLHADCQKYLDTPGHPPHELTTSVQLAKLAASTAETSIYGRLFVLRVGAPARAAVNTAADALGSLKGWLGFK